MKISKNDIKDIKKGENISNELISIVLKDNKYVKHIDNYPDIKEWIETDESSLDLMNKISSAEELTQMVNRYSSADSSEGEQRLSITLKYKAKNSTRKIIASVASIACAVIAISFITYYNGDYNVESNTNLLSNIDVEPTSATVINKPIIMCGDNMVEIGTKANIDVKGQTIANVSDKRIISSVTALDSVVQLTLIMPYGQRYTLLLDDGTEVILNANSSLKYPSKFNGDKREVEMTGSAFFKVAKGERQFIVKTGGIDVSVYGTEFNINAYNSEKIETVLISGSVGVGYCGVKGDRQEIKLKPNEALYFDTNIASHKLVTNVNTMKYKSWNNGYFRYDREPVKVMLEDLSNWYGVKFKYLNDIVKELKISASLSCDMDIDKLLTMIETTSDIKFIKKGGDYLVK